MNWPDQRDSAEELLVRFLVECAAEEERRFRELCAAWPGQASELIRLRAELRCIDRLLLEDSRQRRRWPPWTRRGS